MGPKERLVGMAELMEGIKTYEAFDAITAELHCGC